tara:strand:+ start:113 stop:1102 length:990 start_codon:yes stop_codon:yes gene_type:complete
MDMGEVFQQRVMRVADAPGKVILFGEHAVLYGAPAVAIAIDLRASFSVTNSETWILNGEEFNPMENPYLSPLISKFGDFDFPLSLNIESKIPIAAGLGSSAALSVASALAISSKPQSIEKIARAAHHAEALAQGGRASPTDTSTSALGGVVVVAPSVIDSLEHRWAIDLESPEGPNHWDVHSLQIPENIAGLPLVIGYTGVPSSTKEMVEIVASRMASDSFRSSMDEISSLAQSSINLLKTGTPSMIGDAMNQCHSLLREIGVSSLELESLIDAALPFSYGAKLTGAGGGGCILALAKNPSACAKAIKEAGGVAFVTSIAQQGVKLKTN